MFFNLLYGLFYNPIKADTFPQLEKFSTFNFHSINYSKLLLFYYCQNNNVALAIALNL